MFDGVDSTGKPVAMRPDGVWRRAADAKRGGLEGFKAKSLAEACLVLVMLD